MLAAASAADGSRALVRSERRLERSRGPYVQLFTIFFSRPVEFGLATAMTVLMLVILVRAMFSSEKQTGLSRFVTKPSSRWLFAGLFLVWALVFGIGLQL